MLNRIRLRLYFEQQTGDRVIINIPMHPFLIPASLGDVLVQVFSYILALGTILYLLIKVPRSNSNL